MACAVLPAFVSKAVRKNGRMKCFARDTVVTKHFLFTESLSHHHVGSDYTTDGQHACICLTFMYPLRSSLGSWGVQIFEIFELQIN